MGGTGAFSFCGNNHMQLLVSRRNPKILRPKDNDEWGFTIVRREDPRGNRRTSVYTYLAPNGKLLSFKAKSLPLRPGSYPNKFGASLDWGTFIKLYEFNIQGLKTNIQFDLYYALSLLLPNIALPIRLYERRKGYSGHTFETTLAGLSVRLEGDRGENLEPGYPTSHPISCMGQKIQALVYAFKKGKASNYRRNEGVIFTVNGQTHAHLLSNFFQRDNVGMGYLRDSILVMIDCTRLNPRLLEDLFMNSRDRFRTTEFRSQIERELERILKEHQGLRSLKESRRQEEIEDKLQESRPLAEVIEKVIKNSLALVKLLPFGAKLANPFKLEETGIGQMYEGNKYPTYFRLKRKTHKEIIRSCPINWRFRVQFETDATNDYFNRDDDPGQFTLYANGIEVDNYALSLWYGTANLTVSLPKGTRSNQIIQFNSTVKDATKWQPFEDSFKIIIDSRKPHQKGGTPSEPKPPNGKGTGRQKPSSLTIPNCFDVHRDKWDEHGFDEYDSLDIISIGEGKYDFYVNIDNICLKTELKYSKPSIDIKILTAQFRYAVVLIGMSLIRELSTSENGNQKIPENRSIPDEVKFLSRATSPIIIPMISTLSQLGLEEIESEDTVSINI